VQNLIFSHNKLGFKVKRYNYFAGIKSFWQVISVLLAAIGWRYEYNAAFRVCALGFTDTSLIHWLLWAV
jgi:hypothetical protein